jgi:hypothetical protein
MGVLRMKVVLSAGLIAAAQGYIDYPVFLDPSSRVEATIDRGPIVELIVKCGGGSAIISYSKVEKLYCTPKFKCSAGLKTVLRQTCG